MYLCTAPLLKAVREKILAEREDRGLSRKLEASNRVSTEDEKREKEANSGFTTTYH